jgi:hypothetical protein
VVGHVREHLLRTLRAQVQEVVCFVDRECLRAPHRLRDRLVAFALPQG